MLEQVLATGPDTFVITNHPTGTTVYQVGNIKTKTLTKVLTLHAVYPSKMVSIVIVFGITNSSSFRRRYFQNAFSWVNVLCFDQILLKFAPKGPIDIKSALDLRDGFAPNRWQSITWTKAHQVQRLIGLYAALGGELIAKWNLISLMSVVTPNDT